VNLPPVSLLQMPALKDYWIVDFLEDGRSCQGGKYFEKKDYFRSWKLGRVNHLQAPQINSPEIQEKALEQ
jgi:hypothetical protein